MASLNLNKVILGGRLTADPELKTTQNGTPVCSFSIAVNRRFVADQVDFVNCLAWRAQAEFISKYFHKGSSVCIVGSIQTRSWTDQNNQKRYATEVLAEEINFVDNKSDNAGGQGQTTQDAPKFVEIDHDEELPF